MHYPKEDDGEHYTACLLIKGLRGIEPRILYPKEESGSHCLLILDLKPHSAGLKNGSTIIELGISKGVKKDLLNRAEQITELFYDHSYSEIASILGISARTVSRTVATLGLKRSKSQDSSIRSRIRHDIIRRDKRRITFGFPQITRIKVSGYRPKTRIRHQLKKHGYIVTRGLDVVYYTTDFERNHIKEQKALRFGLRFEPLSIRHKECINL